MSSNKDTYGNADPFSAFYDTRINAVTWHPTSFIDHPLWSQYLTKVGDPGVPRPAGMYGGSTYPLIDNALYPGATVFPSSTTFTGSN